MIGVSLGSPSSSGLIVSPIWYVARRLRARCGIWGDAVRTQLGRCTAPQTTAKAPPRKGGTGRCRVGEQCEG